MRKICLALLMISLFASPAYAGSDMSLRSPYFPARVNDLPGLFFSLFTATQTYFIPVSTADPLPVTGSFSIASATINSVQPYVTTAGVASSSQMDSAGSLNVNVPLQPASQTVRVLTANTELTLTNIAKQSLLSLQNQGVGDVWFKVNASSTVSSGYLLTSGSAVEIKMLSTDNFSVISSTTPTIVSVKQ